MAVRKFTTLIFVTIISSCLGVIICGVSLGTDFWFHGSAIQGSDLPLDVRFGLFRGLSSARTPTFQRSDGLKLVCTDGLCMFSCGKTKELRQADMEHVRGNGTWNNFNLCDGLSRLSPLKNAKVTNVNDNDFMKHSYWLMTVLFLSVAIAFFALAAVLALYNTYRAPTHPILSVLGLLITNGVAAVSVLLAQIMYGLEFGILKKNPNVPETLIGPYTNDIKGSLGFSYWLLILAEILPLINTGILVLRSRFIAKFEEVHHKTIDAKLTSGDVLLF